MDGFTASALTGRDAIDDGVRNERGEELARLAIIFICISGVFVCLRLITRYFHKKVLGYDDALIVGSLILAVGMTVTYNGEAKNGFGLHTSEVSLDHKTLAFEYFFAAQILYKIATCCTKMSLCVLYLRIFPVKHFRYAVFIVMAVTVIYTIVAVFLTIFACRPIAKSWNKALDGVCLDSRSIWYATSIMIILTDVFIIVLPINEIRRLRLPLVKKLMLGCLFGLGVFVVACTIVRMISVSPQTTGKDQIYYQATSNSWTFVETNVGIICACLPVLRIPLSIQLRKVLGLATRNTGSNRTPRSNSYALHGVGNDRYSAHNQPIQGSDNYSVQELIALPPKNGRMADTPSPPATSEKS